MAGVAQKAMGTMSRLHAAMYEWSDGRIGSRMKGLDLVVLTVRGRTTGLERRVPLVAIDYDGDLHVTASAGGSDHHPGWFQNLKAIPTVRVRRGAEEFDAQAEVLEGDVRDRVWEHAKSMMSNFGSYEHKTDRVIPVVRLRPQR